MSTHARSPTLTHLHPPRTARLPQAAEAAAAGAGRLRHPLRLCHWWGLEHWQTRMGFCPRLALALPLHQGQAPGPGHAGRPPVLRPARPAAQLRWRAGPHPAALPQLLRRLLLLPDQAPPLYCLN